MDLVRTASSRPLEVETHQVSTPDGWTLPLHRAVSPGTPGKPVLFIPGFGMNAYIFRYHPRGLSFMQALLDEGFDPWSMDLRGHTAASRGAGAPEHVDLSDHAFVDLPTGFDYVARVTGHDRIHGVGCSLGGALLYAYGGAVPDQRLDRLVAMGTPLRWTKASLVVKAFATVSPLLSFYKPRGTRHFARLGLPVVRRLLPGALAVYLNPRITHTTPANALSRTVEDPEPLVNRALGRWIKRTDLDIGGVNITRALRSFHRPLLVVAGNGDRICPPETALAALEYVAGPADSLVVGRRGEHVSHADLFISDIAPLRVFRPIARWLADR